MSFEAKYHGRCADCGESIAPGDRAKFDGDAVVHEVCESAPDPAALRPGEVVCTECWLVQPCGCEVS